MSNIDENIPPLEEYSKNSPLDAKTSGNDAMRVRIEGLEREKINLSLQIHILEDKERNSRSQYGKLENRIKEGDDERRRLEKVVEGLRSTASLHNSEKERLEGEIRRLTKESQQADSLRGNQPPSVWQKMTAATRELRKAEDELRALQDENAQIKAEKAALVEQVASQERNLHRLENEGSEMRNDTALGAEAISRNVALTAEVDALTTRLAEADSALVDAAARLEAEKENYRREKFWNRDHRERLEAEIEELKRSLEDERANVKTTGAPLSQQTGMSTLCENKEGGSPEALVTADAARYEHSIALLTDKLNESEAARRDLHNQLQDLKGNVRVFVRCRPFLPMDGDIPLDRKAVVCTHVDGATVSVPPKGPGQPHLFKFDHAFGTDASQDDVFKQASQLVQSVMDGYKVCIFSYGQTGSGKTHTMTGDFESTTGDQGIIPRAVEQVLTSSCALRDKGWTCSLTVSVVELYNEEPRDLLAASGTAAQEREKVQFSKDALPLKISFSNGSVSVGGLSYEPLLGACVSDGMRQLRELLSRSNRARTTASTQMNSVSSRSHVLFMLNVDLRNPADGTVLQGGLRLVDLAGSERLARTGTLNDAARLKESVNINKSLSCLADVFCALGRKGKNNHVPYRNSKLTLLLQDCLSGDGKALMMVNYSPTEASQQETMCSLRFANQVSQVEMGKAQRNIAILTQAAVPVATPVTAPSSSSSSSRGAVRKAVTASETTSSGPRRSHRDRVTANPTADALNVTSGDLSSSTSGSSSGAHTDRAATASSGSRGKRALVSSSSSNSSSSDDSTPSAEGGGAKRARTASSQSDRAAVMSQPRRVAPRQKWQ